MKTDLRRKAKIYFEKKNNYLISEPVYHKVRTKRCGTF